MSIHRLPFVSFVVAYAVFATASISAQQPPLPRFRTEINLVLVDVVVRDRSGNVVTGLSADDFEVFEDGVRQHLLTFAFESVERNAAPLGDAAVLAAAADRGATPPTVSAGAA